MPQCPVCYFAFANARDAGHLQFLKKESRAIRLAQKAGGEPEAEVIIGDAERILREMELEGGEE